MLWDLDTAGNECHLTKDRHESLVSKAIAYLLELSPPKWIKKPGQGRDQCTLVKNYLEVLDDNEPGGHLCQYITFEDTSDQRV